MKREVSRGLVYIVQFELDHTQVHVFSERTVLCKTMERLEKLKGNPVEWKKGTLDYHFNTKKEKEFQYRGYWIYMRLKHKGKSRGRYTNVEVKKLKNSTY